MVQAIVSTATNSHHSGDMTRSAKIIALLGLAGADDTNDTFFVSSDLR